MGNYKRLPENENHQFIQGYICAICTLIRMNNDVDTQTKELFRSGVGQMTIGALERRGVPENDLLTLQDFWLELH